MNHESPFRVVEQVQPRQHRALADPMTGDETRSDTSRQRRRFKTTDRQRTGEIERGSMGPIVHNVHSLASNVPRTHIPDFCRGFPESRRRFRQMFSPMARSNAGFPEPAASPRSRSARFRGRSARSSGFDLSAGRRPTGHSRSRSSRPQIADSMPYRAGLRLARRGVGFRLASRRNS